MDKKGKPSDQGIQYNVFYRDVKYARLEYKTGTLTLILPRDYENERSILEKHRTWITQKTHIINQALEKAKAKTLNKNRTDEELRSLVVQKVDKYKQRYAFSINKVYFRRMKSKWGSCSSKGNLTINRLLKYLPEELIDYIVFHEMVHSQEKRHNELFWSYIGKEFTSWQTFEKDLLVYWFLIKSDRKG